MDWRDESTAGAVERRTEGEARPRRKWSRVERWLRDRLRRPGAWLILAAVGLVVPAFFSTVGGAVWEGLLKWTGGCVYVGLAYHAVRRHVAFAPAVMMALGCGVSWLTVALMVEAWRANEAGAAWSGGWGMSLWMGCAVLGGLVGLETLRDGSWWAVRLMGGAVAAGLVLWGGGGSVGAWVLLGLAAGLTAWDAGRGRATMAATAASLAGVGLTMAGGVALASAFGNGGPGSSSGPPIMWRVIAEGDWAWAGHLIHTVPSYWSGVMSLDLWWWETVRWQEVTMLSMGTAVLAWPVLAWGWWRWSRQTGDLLVLCCPWVALLISADAGGRAILLALLPMAWLSVWRLAMRYEKRRLTIMAGLVVIQAGLTTLMMLRW
ncbi:MAG: hypothetical protein AAF823_03555 [Planctomycetota bacterium]